MDDRSELIRWLPVAPPSERVPPGLPRVPEPTRAGPIASIERYLPPPAPLPEKTRKPQPNQTLGWDAESNLDSAEPMAELASLVSLVAFGLEKDLGRLLALNRGRRELIRERLLALAGKSARSSSDRESAQPGGGSGEGDRLAELLADAFRSDRDETLRQAVRVYLEELALVAIGQALVVKSWSDRGIRMADAEDLPRAQWVIARAIQAAIPPERAILVAPAGPGSARSIYSWLQLSKDESSEVWRTLARWDLSTHAPGFLAGFLRRASRRRSQVDAAGFDPRFLQAAFEHRVLAGTDRKIRGFSPTLRDGSAMRALEPRVEWHGAESDGFLLAGAELARIWAAPRAPALWVEGTGLDTHVRPQLPLGFGAAAASQKQRLGEMEAFDAALVLEERTQRSRGRDPGAERLRRELESLPYFQAVRAGGACLGILQACVSLSKLRPGGRLVWARNEALGPEDGENALRFLLDHGKLVGEWDLADARHAVQGNAPRFPRYTYVIERESRNEIRLAHRPSSVRLEGGIRSHIEIPGFLQRLLAGGPEEGAESAARAHWGIRVSTSPFSQRDWLARWPGRGSADDFRRLDRLAADSIRLGALASLRPAPRPGEKPIPLAEGGALTIGQLSGEGARRLVAQRSDGPVDIGGTVLVLLARRAWLEPLASYLESEIAALWLDHHVERRGGNWLLADHSLEGLPVPKALFHALEQPEALPPSNPWTAYLRLCENARELAGKLAKLDTLVDREGAAIPARVVQLLAPKDLVPLPLHSGACLKGVLPPEVPITRAKPLAAQGKSRSVLLATEAGHSLTVDFADAFLAEVAWGQISALENRAWSEISKLVRLPRSVEHARALAEELAGEARRLRSVDQRCRADIERALATCLGGCSGI